ncbi:MAG: O-methyltransferase [Bdellovibrionota bacterium]
MNKNFGQNDPKIVDYVEKLFRPEDAILREVRIECERKGLPAIQVGSMDALHLEVITRAIGAQKAVEIGTLGGYSGVSILRGMSPQGKLYTFEYVPLHAEVAKKSFENAGFADRVEIYVGSALANLPKIKSQGPFDLVFIDADKETYPYYLKWAAENLRIGGVVLGDNTFAWGRITDEAIEEPETQKSVLGLREFNQMAAQGGRFRSTILPTGEGLTMAVKVK